MRTIQPQRSPLVKLPPELLLAVAKMLGAKDVLALARTCQKIGSVLMSLHTPSVVLRYPRVSQTTFEQEQHLIREQLRLLSHVLRRFRRVRVVTIDRGPHDAYAPGLLFLRDIICKRLPHLFAPVAATLTADQIRSPLNGSTLEHMAEARGQVSVVEAIRALPRGGSP